MASPEATGMKTRILWRHGVWELNNWANLTGTEAEQVADKVVTEEMNYLHGLLPEGKTQAAVAGAAIRGRWPVQAVLFSPYRRTRQTAGIGFSGYGIQMELSPGLKERDRGLFAYQPSENIRNHPYYWVDEHGTSREDVLGYRPPSRNPQQPCETLHEVNERLEPSLHQADRLAPDGVAVLVTSADVIIGARGLLGGFSSERLRQPLIDNPPEGYPGLKRSNWIQNVQADIYYWGNPETGELADSSGPPVYLASLSAYKPTFDTGLIDLSER